MATVKAIQNGFLNAPTTVIRNGEEHPAQYIYAGDIFEWDGPMGKWMEEVVAVEEEPATADKAAIMEELRSRGIKFFKGASVEKLSELLKENTP